MADTMDQPIFLGFDPGGANKFGVALLQGERTLASVVSTVAAALEWASKACGSTTPVAAGIDTLLHWCDGPSGWRPADWKLRKAYPKIQASIMSPNGLAGSMSIGGMALAIRLRQCWPGIRLNETHPKVLMHALGAERYADEAATAAIASFNRYSRLSVPLTASGHELDAMLSAWATGRGIQENWADLLEGHPSLLYPAGQVTYLWHKDFDEQPCASDQTTGPDLRPAQRQG